MKKIVLLFLLVAAQYSGLHASGTFNGFDAKKGENVTGKKVKKFESFAEKLEKRKKRNALFSFSPLFTDYLPLTGGSIGGALTVFNFGGVPLRVQGWDDISGNDANSGSLYIGGSSYYASIHYNASSPSLYFDNSYNSDNGDFYFRTKVSGTPIYAMTIKGSGNVGIGTTAPLAPLHVNTNYAGVVTQMIIENVNSSTDAGSSIFFKGYYNQAKISVHEHPSNYSGGNLQLQTYFDNSTLNTGVMITRTGKVGINTTTPTEQLSVNGSFSVNGNASFIGNVAANGNIITKKVTVTQLGWSDYVFDEGYTLRSLASVEKYIGQNKHLPDVPSAKEVEKGGIDLGDTQALLLRKIEELTLYLIAQDKKINAISRENVTLRALIKKATARK